MHDDSTMAGMYDRAGVGVWTDEDEWAVSCGCFVIMCTDGGRIGGRWGILYCISRWAPPSRID